MTKAKPKEISWLSDVEEHDYAAAESYLCLVYRRARVTRMMAEFRQARVVQFKAKDVFRASGLSLLGVSNLHVEKDREKIRKGQGLSALLLVRDEENGKVIIADGYHRLCASYECNEDEWVHCKII